MNVPFSMSRLAAHALDLWLVVPVKPFGEGKGRLSGVLTPEMRADHSRRWLIHVLTTARTWGRFTALLVISRDPAVLTLAAELGAQPLVEEGDGLNAALAQAQAYAVHAGADAVLALPSDLPLLSGEDLAELYDLALEGPGVVIAPAHDGGTNALLLRPPGSIPYAFGENSFAGHCALAAANHLPCRAYHSETLALDIDYPEDLLVLEQ
jgi:2-phospho-L-lactate guanylyltransferase